MSTALSYLDDDGYTQRAFIKAKPRLHGELRLAFRPMRGQDRVRNGREVKSMDAEAAEEYAVKVCATRIVSWDLKDKKGNPIPVSAAAINRLHTELYFRVLAIAYHCVDGGDADPEGDEEERKRSLELSKETGLPVGEAAIAKNDGT